MVPEIGLFNEDEGEIVAEAADADLNKQTVAPMSRTPRSYFPETWLWVDALTG